MVQSKFLGAGPLTAAAVQLSERSPDMAAGRGDPAVLLAGMMDLRGSVDLAQTLKGLDRASPLARLRPPQAPGARRGASPVKGLTVERLARLEGLIERMFADPFQRRNKLPSAAQALEVLEQTGALAGRAGRPLAAAGERLWEPFGALFSSAVTRVRDEARAIREELTPRLQAGGPRLARLERLDAALLGATESGRARLVGDLLEGLGRAFRRGLGAAVKALPATAGPADVAPWFSPGGFLRGEVARGHGVVAAVLAHERRRLEALAEAASELGAVEAPRPAPP